MVDIVDPETRRRMMSNIRGADTKPELIVRKYLHRAGLRFRLHDRRLPGRPDIVLPKYRAVVFVHGCFWHRHPGCKYAYTPKTRPEFWLDKLSGNVVRDSQNVGDLHIAGWRVFQIWECEVRDAEVLNRLAAAIRSPGT